MVDVRRLPVGEGNEGRIRWMSSRGRARFE